MKATLFPGCTSTRSQRGDGRSGVRLSSLADATLMDVSATTVSATSTIRTGRQRAEQKRLAFRSFITLSSFSFCFLGLGCCCLFLTVFVLRIVPDQIRQWL